MAKKLSASAISAKERQWWKRGVDPNFTYQDYLDMLEDQNNQCCICKCNFRKKCLDHDHKTGKVRGILCVRCNRGLGYFADSAARVQKAAEYMSGVSL